MIAAGAAYDDSVTIDAGRRGRHQAGRDRAERRRAWSARSPRSARPPPPCCSTPTPASTVGVRLAGTGQIGVVTGTGNSHGRPAGCSGCRSSTPTRCCSPGQQLVTFGSVGGRPYVPGVPVGVITRVVGSGQLADQDRASPPVRRRHRAGRGRRGDRRRRGTTRGILGAAAGPGPAPSATVPATASPGPVHHPPAAPRRRPRAPPGRAAEHAARGAARPRLPAGRDPDPGDRAEQPAAPRRVRARPGPGRRGRDGAGRRPAGRHADRVLPPGSPSTSPRPPPTWSASTRWCSAWSATAAGGCAGTWSGPPGCRSAGVALGAAAGELLYALTGLIFGDPDITWQAVRPGAARVGRLRRAAQPVRAVRGGPARRVRPVGGRSAPAGRLSGRDLAAAGAGLLRGRAPAARCATPGPGRSPRLRAAAGHRADGWIGGGRDQAGQRAGAWVDRRRPLRLRLRGGAAGSAAARPGGHGRARAAAGRPVSLRLGTAAAPRRDRSWPGGTGRGRSGAAFDGRPDRAAGPPAARRRAVRRPVGRSARHGPQAAAARG